MGGKGGAKLCLVLCFVFLALEPTLAAPSAVETVKVQTLGNGLSLLMAAQRMTDRLPGIVQLNQMTETHDKLLGVQELVVIQQSTMCMGIAILLKTMLAAVVLYLVFSNIKQSRKDAEMRVNLTRNPRLLSAFPSLGDSAVASTLTYEHRSLGDDVIFRDQFVATLVRYEEVGEEDAHILFDHFADSINPSALKDLLLDHTYSKEGEQAVEELFDDMHIYADESLSKPASEPPEGKIQLRRFSSDKWRRVKIKSMFKSDSGASEFQKSKKKVSPRDLLDFVAKNAINTVGSQVTDTQQPSGSTDKTDHVQTAREETSGQTTQKTTKGVVDPQNPRGDGIDPLQETDGVQTNAGSVPKVPASLRLPPNFTLQKKSYEWMTIEAVAGKTCTGAGKAGWVEITPDRLRLRIPDPPSYQTSWLLKTDCVGKPATAPMGITPPTD